MVGKYGTNNVKMSTSKQINNKLIKRQNSNNKILRACSEQAHTEYNNDNSHSTWNRMTQNRERFHFIYRTQIIYTGCVVGLLKKQKQEIITKWHFTNTCKNSAITNEDHDSEMQFKNKINRLSCRHGVKYLLRIFCYLLCQYLLHTTLRTHSHIFK
jgi:hypothetical protein